MSRPPFLRPVGDRPQRQPERTEPTPVEVCDNLEPARITQARHLAGMSRRDLAEAVGTTPARVGLWECAALAVKPYELLRIAEATEQLVAFFARGRPMAHISAADCHFRPQAYRDDTPPWLRRDQEGTSDA